MKPLNLFAGIALAAASMASVAYTPGAGIAGTPHDWSGVSATKLLQWVDGKGRVTTYNTGTPYVDPATGKQGATTVTIGQCTKCHTPHLEPHTAGDQLPVGLPRHDGRYAVCDVPG